MKELWTKITLAHNIYTIDINRYMYDLCERRIEDE